MEYDEFYIPNVFTGGLTANKAAQSSPYTLGPDEFLEVRRMEIYSPVTGGGVSQELDYVQLMVEGSSYDHVFLRGKYDQCMAPPVDERSFRVATNLGVPIYQTPVASAIRMTCPKVAPKKSLGVRVVAGGTDITEDFEIDLLVVKYKGIDTIRALLGDTYDAGVYLKDVERGKVASVPKTIPVTAENWNKLPGGVNQSVPMVHPYIRFALNSKATTPSTAYAFNFDTEKVEREDMDMAWTFDSSEGIVMNQIGVYPHINSRQTWWYMDGRDRPGEAPFQTTLTKNKLPLGTQDQKQGPYSLKRSPLFWDMKAEIRHMDNGTLIPINGVMVAMWGTHILMR